jgi:hypothetical protein
MTTANIQIKKILVGRGNTAVASTYSGVRGEIVLDTGLNTLRVYDGTTTGGTVLATSQQIATIANLVANTSIRVGNVPPAVSTTGTLWYDSEGGRTYIRYANAWVDASPSVTNVSITDLTANVAQLQGILEEFGQELGVAFGTIQGNIDTLTSNAQTLTSNFNSYKTYANANAVAITTRAQSLSSNLGAFQTYANLNINSLAYQTASTTATLAAYQTYANANARALAYSLKSLDANVGRILLYETSTGSGANVTVDTTPPIVNSTGSLWWDTEDGRLYLRYNNTWVDASPTTLDLGKFIFDTDQDRAFISTTDDAGGKDGYDIVLIPGGEGYSSITIPRSANAANGAPLSIEATNANSAVQISTDAGTWTFGNTGTLTIPDSSTIRTQNWGSFSLKSDNADIVIMTDVDNSRGWIFGGAGQILTLPAGSDIRDSVSNISVLKTRIGDTYSTQFFQQLTIAHDEGKLITINHDGLFRLPQITANLLGAEFEFYFSADAGQVYIQAFYTDNRATTDRFVGSVFVGVDNDVTGRLHTATAGVADANYLFLGQHHARAGSYIRFKAIAFDGVGTWLVQGQCVGDSVNTTPNGHSYMFQNYYD